MSITTPADIPGLVAWYSADAAASAHPAGGGVSTWQDLSGNGHHLTAAEPATLPALMLTGGKAGGPAFGFSEAVRNGFNVPASLVTVLNAAAGIHIGASFRTGARGEEGLWGLQSQSDSPQSHAPYSGRMYDGACSSGRWDWAVAGSTWYRYQVFANRNVGGNPNWSAWLDGTAKVSSASAAGVGLRPDPVIGHSRGNGLTSGTTFGGRFGAVVFYGRQLTAGERTDLEAWLTANPSGGLPALDPPADLTATATGPTTGTVTWSAAAGASGYEYRVDAGAPVAAAGSPVDLAGLLPATTYAVEVRAVAGDGRRSPWIGPAAFTTGDPIPPDRRWWTQRLASEAGLDPTATQPVVQVRLWDGAGFVVDAALSRALQSYQVTYGRKDATSRVEALTASLVWATPYLEATPAVATRLQVAISPAVCAAIGLDPDDGIRFTGEVTDPAVAHARRLTSAAAAGRLGRANRMPVDGTAWPVEDDAGRVGRVLAAAGVGLQVGTIDPGTMLVAAPTRLETVATLLEQASVSTLGQVVEQPSGRVDYHDAEHRRDPVVAVTLSAGDVFRDVTWTQRLSSLVNDLDVKTAAGALVTVNDTESSDPNRYGPWPGSLDTILTTTTDALMVGVDIVGRRADPSWQLPDLTVDLLRTVDLDDLAAVLALRHGSLLEVVDLPPAFPNDGRVFVEGYVETATPRSWTLALSVTDRLQSGVGIRWIDWPDTDAYQWQDLHPDLTWLDLARIYDPAETL